VRVFIAATATHKPDSKMPYSQINELSAHGLPDGIKLQKPKNYTLATLKKIVALKNNISISRKFSPLSITKYKLPRLGS